MINLTRFCFLFQIHPLYLYRFDTYRGIWNKKTKYSILCFLMQAFTDLMHFLCRVENFELPMYFFIVLRASCGFFLSFLL